MGIRDQIKIFRRNRSKNLSHRKSIFNLVAPNQVTEQSLQVWRALPEQIRQDPSLVSFQIKNDRLHGSSTNTERYINTDEIQSNPEESNNGSEFINMKIFKSKDGSTNLCPCELKGISHCIINHTDSPNENKETTKKVQREKLIKKVCLMIFWILSTLILLSTHEKHLFKKQLLVPEYEDKFYFLPKNPIGDFKITLIGPFAGSKTGARNVTDGDFLTVQLQMVDSLSWNDTEVDEEVLQIEEWIVPTVSEDEYDISPLRSKNKTFILSPGVLNRLEVNNTRLRLKMYTNESSIGFAMKIIYDPLVINVKEGIVFAVLILSGFYALLVWEVFHRTFIAIICSTASIAVLAILGDRPTMEEIVVWMDFELLTLLFSMMILVAILTETGVFDYLAVLTFEISGGKIWPLIYSLFIISCCVSSVLDNMTTVLLMTPVAIRLCDVMEIDPVPVIMGIVVHSNIGGAITPIGDPISIIVCSNHFISQNGVTFTNFVVHSLPGVILTVIFSCVYMKLTFWDIKSLRHTEPKAIKELRREIVVWTKAANSLSSYSKDVDLVRETLQKKVEILKYKLKKKQAGVGSTDVYKQTLEELKAAYPIKNKTLLVQAVFTLIFVIIMFFVQSMPSLRTLPLGWVALLGVVFLMIISNRSDMDAMVTRIEWTTLLFFAAMFIIMECVERLGLFTWIGTQTENMILFVSKENRLATAILIILWISAMASAILDSIPVTAMMVKVVVSLVGKETLGLPLQPLVWALLFGCCLGGNGTLYGASANVLAAGIAEQHGYKITFTRYLKFVFPMMVGQIAIITSYLTIAHILYEWN